MRTDLLGLPVEEATQILLEEGICPEIRETRAPRRTEGGMRVIRATEDGILMVSPFADPVES